MGSIYERLQNLQEERRIKAEELKKEEHEFNARKMVKYNEEIVASQREQYPKFKQLEEFGILEMLADATQSEIKSPEWPLTQEETRERWNQHLEALKNNNHKRLPKKSAKEKEEDIRNINELLGKNFSQPDKYWDIHFMEPELNDELEWNTDAKIQITKKVRNLHRRSLSDYSEIARVSIIFNGNLLSISGAEPTFNDLVPAGPQERTEVLEEAFVKAFDNPLDLRQKPNPLEHTHPELVVYG
jgi:hypothetical protein